MLDILLQLVVQRRDTRTPPQQSRLIDYFHHQNLMRKPYKNTIYFHQNTWKNQVVTDQKFCFYGQVFKEKLLWRVLEGNSLAVLPIYEPCKLYYNQQGNHMPMYGIIVIQMCCWLTATIGFKFYSTWSWTHTWHCVSGRKKIMVAEIRNHRGKPNSIILLRELCGRSRRKILRDRFQRLVLKK